MSSFSAARARRSLPLLTVPRRCPVGKPRLHYHARRRMLSYKPAVLQPPLGEEADPRRAPANQPFDLTPCIRCVWGEKTKRDSALQRYARGKAGGLSYTLLGAASSSMASTMSRGKTKVGTYVTTNTGSLCHLDEACNSLRFAKQKHWASAKPTGLNPCPRCIGDPNGGRGRPRAWWPIDKVIVGSTSGSGGRPRVRTYITTKTGKYYHGDEDCRYLAIARM